MKNSILFSLLVFIFTFSSCKKEEANLVWVKHSETACSEVWGTGIGHSSAEVETALQVYFDALSLDFEDFNLTTNQDGSTCLACTCPSGRTIKLQIKEIDFNNFEAEGFSLE